MRLNDRGDRVITHYTLQPMSSSSAQRLHVGQARRAARATVVALAVAAILLGASALPSAAQPPVDAAAQNLPAQSAEAAAIDVLGEIRLALVRLPTAALLGAVLALRPRRKGQGTRSVTVVQTQIMLAVVGAVIMLVVGNSLSRAFGIVGAAGLVRYRSNIADPKDAVVMLSALSAGLAAGVGLYPLAAFATVFMAALLSLVEYFEPTARRRFELRVLTKSAVSFRSKLEGVLKGLDLHFELMAEEEDELRYMVMAPVEVQTRDVSDTLKLLGGDDLVVKWAEKRQR